METKSQVALVWYDRCDGNWVKAAVEQGIYL